jgi:integrase/recombinase XerD
MNKTSELILSEAQRETLPIELNPVTVYLSGLANQRVRDVQRQAVETVSEYLIGSKDILSINWSKLRYSHCQMIRSKLVEHYSASTTNRILSALRGVLKAAFLNDQMKAEDYQKAIMVKNVKGETVPAGRELSSDELEKLMKVCLEDNSNAGIRDAAIIALLYSGGLRRAELVNATNYSNGKLVITGKGNKERTIYLENGAKDAMDAWLKIRGYAQGFLFWPINKSGKMRNAKLTTQAVYNILVKRGEEAGIENFSPHDMRRTFISDLLANGIDISTVSRMAGHASVQTTARYDRRPEEEKQKAAKTLNIYYHKK